MHYREEEIEEELLEEDHDSGILGELQTEADSYSSGSDSGTNNFHLISRNLNSEYFLKSRAAWQFLTLYFLSKMKI